MPRPARGCEALAPAGTGRSTRRRRGRISQRYQPVPLSALICSLTALRITEVDSRVSSGRELTPRFSSLRVSSSSERMVAGGAADFVRRIRELTAGHLDDLANGGAQLLCGAQRASLGLLDGLFR